MALHDELLAHSLTSLRLDDSEASARRAVSAGYYALFHLLVTESVERMIPAEPPGLRNQARRAFTHANMLAVCSQFARGQIHKATRQLVTPPIEQDLAVVANVFLMLQEARHQADYDLGFVATQLWATERVELSRDAFALWHGIRNTSNATVFLIALGLHPHWNRGG